MATGGLLGAFALSAFAANTWTAPASAPPAGNVDAPLNIGSTVQTKVGGSIQINGGFGVVGGTMIYQPVPTAPPTVGQVLTAKDTVGTLGWVSTSTLLGPAGNTSVLGNSVHGMIQYTTNSTWTAPAGVNTVTIELAAGGDSYGGCVDPYVSSWSNGGSAKGVYTVTPGKVYTIKIGGGGSAATPTSFVPPGTTTPLIYATASVGGCNGAVVGGVGHGQINVGVYNDTNYVNVIY